MAVKKPMERRPLDAAVSSAMGDDPLYGEMAERASKARSQTAAQRKQSQRDAKRNKVTYDLAEEISEGVSRVAESLGVPPAHVAGFLLRYGLAAVEEGKLDLRRYRVVSRSLRYGWSLDLSADCARVPANAD
jgi:hypothetical protein